MQVVQIAAKKRFLPHQRVKYPEKSIFGNRES